jgi:organic radical activating enzyme
VKDSWDADKWPLRSVQEIVDEAGNYQSKLVVVTGGEPFMYNLDGLTSELKAKGFHINVETSGAHPFSGTVDWVCLSPKKFKAPMSEWYEMADELKIIIFNESDFKWAEQHAALVDDKCKLLLQPEWSKQEKMTPYIIEYVKQHPKWSISLQTHKYLDIP